MTNKRQSIRLALLASAACLFSMHAQSSCKSENYIGSVCWMAGNFCPVDYLPANGQLLAISSNEALFFLLGTNHGGDGRTNFGLPDLRGRVAVGEGQGPGQINRRLGQKFGNETRYISANEALYHNHTVDLTGLSYSDSITAVSETGTSNNPEGNYPSTSAVGKIYETSADSQLKTGSVAINSAVDLSTSSAGYNDSIALREAQLGLTPYIKSVGLYPPRT